MLGSTFVGWGPEPLATASGERYTMLKRLIAVGGLAVLAMAAPAAAQQYPPAVNTLTCSDTTPAPGQTITVEGRTFAPGGTATVMLGSEVTLGSATANAAGVFALQATIPANTPLGPQTLVATGPAANGQTLTLSIVCQVVAAQGGGAGPTSNLPRTGSDTSIPLAKIGLGLLALGGVIYAVASKRRRALSAVSS